MTTNEIQILIRWNELRCAQAKTQANKKAAECKIEDFQFYLRIIEDGKLSAFSGLPKTIDKRLRQIPPEKDWQRKVPCKFCQEDFPTVELGDGWCQTCLDE